MSSIPDIRPVADVVAAARRRIRMQRAIEGATTASILACATALAAIFAVRIDAISASLGIAGLALAVAIVIGGAMIAASHRLRDERIARRVDRASGLADRLSTAVAFHSAPLATDDAETRAFMLAAIADGVRAAPRANVAAATPFHTPKDGRAASAFALVCALCAGLSIPHADKTAHLYRVSPDHAPPGAIVTLEGDHLFGETGVVPASGTAIVYLGASDQGRPMRLRDWSDREIVVEIPTDAPIGDTLLTPYLAGAALASIGFGVVDPTDTRYHTADSVVLEPDDKAYIESILAQLHAMAKSEQVPELEDFASKIEQLMKGAELGKITKEKLLDALAKAEQAMAQSNESNPAEVANKLKDMGQELAKDPMTKQLGEALSKNDLDKAKQELEKLADKLDRKELSDKQKQALGKKLDEVAKQMAKKDQAHEAKRDSQQQKLEQQVRELQDKKQQAKTDEQRQDLERRFEEKKRELQKLEKDKQDKDKSDQRRALQRLEKDMEKAAESLQKPKPDQDQQGQEERDHQASQKLKDAARETGRVDQDQRKVASQKKLSSQMDDLREALRRAKQKGNKGPSDPFAKNEKNQDFNKRARGQQGSRQVWKPGQQGQGSGQGGGQPGADGQDPGGKEPGTGHDPNLTGDSTAKSGNTKEEQLQGTSGSHGTSRRETILAAAEKGFASASYQKVYADYKTIVEEVMRTEKLPASYKYYVKKYFAKIHPTLQDADEPAGKSEDHP